MIAWAEAPALRTGPWEEREPGRKWARNDLGGGAWALVDVGPGAPAYRWSASLNGEDGSGWHHTPKAARDAADAWLASRGVVLDTQPDAPEPVVLDRKATLRARPPDRGEFEALAERVAALEARAQPAPTPGTGDAPTARDPRQDPRAGDVLWVRGCAVQVEGFHGGCVFASLRWTLDEWRERTAGADVLRVAP